MKQIKFIFGTLFVVVAFWVLIIPTLAEAGKNKSEAPAAKAPVILEAVEDGDYLHILGHNLVDEEECPEVSLGDMAIDSGDISCVAGTNGDPDMVSIMLPEGVEGSLLLGVMTPLGAGSHLVAFGDRGTAGDSG